MLILDSNIWIGFLNIDDSNHNKATQLFKEIKEKITLPEYVILETATLVSQKVNKQAADAFIKNVIDNKDIEILPSSREFLQDIIALYLAHKDKNLSLVDYALVLLSQKAEVLTFDKNLKRKIEKLWMFRNGF